MNEAVNAQVEIQTSLANADIDLTKRGQWMLYSIALTGLVAAIVFGVLGLTGLAITGVVISALSISVNLITSVTASRRGSSNGPHEASDAEQDSETDS